MKGAWAIWVGLVAVLLLSAPAAQAAATRGEYVTQAEPICRATFKAATKKSKKIFKGLKFSIVAGDDKAKPTASEKRKAGKAALRFFHAVGRADILYGRTINRIGAQLVAIPPPEADAGVVAQWIESRRVLAEELKDIGQRIRSAKSLKKLFGVFFSTPDLDKALSASDALVGDWGFSDCVLSEDSQAPTL